MAALAVLLAQQVLPAVPLMRGGLADPREPRVAVGVIATDLFAHPLRAREGQGFPAGTDLKSDRQGLVQLGTNMPLLRAGPLVFSLQGGVTSRFRLEARDNDLASSDYMVALPVTYACGAYTTRVRVLHRSSHLGDELVLNTSIRRLEFTHNEIDALLAREFSGWRAYAGGTVTLSSYFEHDKHGVQLGVDGAKRIARGSWLIGGADWQRHTIQGTGSLSLNGGLELRGGAGRAALVGQFLNGASPVGEFFLQRERYWGIALQLSRSGGTGNLAGLP